MSSIILFLSLWAINSQEIINEFRGFKWGETKSEIKSKETLPIHHDYENELAYFSDEIPEIEDGVKYYFDNGKLIEGVFLSRNLHKNAKDYYLDYLIIQKYFDDLLGVHLSEDWHWTGEKRKGNTAEIGESIMSGDLKITNALGIQ